MAMDVLITTYADHGSISAWYVPYRTCPALSFEFSPGESMSARPTTISAKDSFAAGGDQSGAEQVFHDDEEALGVAVAVGVVVQVWELFGRGGYIARLFVGSVARIGVNTGLSVRYLSRGGGIVVGWSLVEFGGVCHWLLVVRVC